MTVIVLLTGVALILVGLQLFIEPWTGWLVLKGKDEIPQIRVFAPEDTSVYRMVAEALRENLTRMGASADRRYRFKVQPDLTPSVGSLDTIVNLDRLKASEGQHVYGIGLAQADVLYHYVFGGHPELDTPRTSSNIRSMARMFDEWLFIGVPNTQQGKTQTATYDPEFVSAARHVCAQEVGTGSMVTAINMGRTMESSWLSSLHDCSPPCFKEFAELEGPPVDEPPEKTASTGEPSDAESSGLCVKVRARFEGSSLKSRANWHYLGLPKATAVAMASVFDKSYSFQEDVLARDYPDSARPDTASSTVAVDAILVLSRDMPPPVVGAMQCLVDDWDVKICHVRARSGFRCTDYALPRVDRKTKKTLKASDFCTKIRTAALDLKRKTLLTAAERHDLRFGNLPISRHGATIVGDLGPISALLIRLSLGQLQGLAILLLGGFLFFYSRAIGRAGMHTWLHLHGRSVRTWLYRSLAFVLAHAVIAVLIWLAESHSQALLANDKFVAGGIISAFAWVIKYVATGNGDVNFQSPWALTCVASLKLGWGIAVLVIGYDFQKRAMDYFKAVRMKNHVVVIGWNSGTPSLLEELTIEHDCFVIPFLTSPVWTGSPRASILPEPVTALSESALHQAQFSLAAAVVIVADHEYAKSKGMGVDSLTLRNIESCRRFETSTKVIPRKRLIAEIMEPENVPVADSLGQLDSASFDALCTRQNSATFMAQVALKPALAQLFKELATTKDESNELYMVRASDLQAIVAFGTFDELKLLLAGQTGEFRVVPIGIQKSLERRLRVNPDSRDAMVEAEDEIAFLARSREQVFLAAQALDASKHSGKRAISASG